MEEQEYILEKPESFELKHIFECGQCFRWNEQQDGSYIGVIKQGVIQVQKQGDKIVFYGNCRNGLRNAVNDYFDLDNNYDKIKQKLAKIDVFMRNSTTFGAGIRILHQDLWETIISFIISANNNIPRIKKIIERISQEYGEKIELKGKIYHTFPTPEALSKATIAELRACGLGFRDKRVFHTTRMVLEKEIDLEQLKCINDSEKLRNELLKLDGVGRKVADCILLFALKRFDVFPIDVWVRRVMNELYIHESNEEKVNQKMLLELANQKFFNLAGVAQQYLYYWKRETS